MAGKNNEVPTEKSGDIGTIRNILMGQQMAEYQSEFAGIRQKMTDDHADLTGKLKAFGEETDERFAKLEKEIAERFDRLEKLVKENVERLDQKFHEMSKADKQDLGQMLAEISKKLTS
jgi:DNA anti-recombination protein RmuC